ncbi:hypothetical protein HID58_040504 [Brassica napus]|uniref:(rape) hypothetical protein n=1 Tax=Brassica napus TaxID=3708 RepID=A0A816R2F1_BRANA|nr:hypothetical protein HID58_040504 [Brassica napus]CAF2068357.1 unnamed protein product [Brassica napus]
MEGESSTPHPVIIFLMVAGLAYVDYPRLWRCFVGIEFRIHTSQFMWKRNIIFFSIWIVFTEIDCFQTADWQGKDSEDQK